VQRAALLLSTSLLAAVALPAAALDFCSSVGKVEPPAAKMEPCEGIAFLARITAKCAAEMPEDHNLQRHAAGILELENKRKVDTMVRQGLRATQADPEHLHGRKIDPVLLDRQIAMQEALAAKTEADLREKRALAASAGYSQPAKEGTAQTVIDNAVWRYLDGTVQPHVAGCSQSEAGKKAAGEFAGMLGVAMSHGNAIEREVMRQLLGK
jgi:hypothetical protein